MRRGGAQRALRLLIGFKWNLCDAACVCLGAAAGRSHGARSWQARQPASQPESWMSGQPLGLLRVDASRGGARKQRLTRPRPQVGPAPGCHWASECRESRAPDLGGENLCAPSEQWQFVRPARIPSARATQLPARPPPGLEIAGRPKVCSRAFDGRRRHRRGGAGKQIRLNFFFSPAPFGPPGPKRALN